MNSEIELKMEDAELPENDRKQIRFFMAWVKFRERFESGHVFRFGDVYDAFEAGVEHGNRYMSSIPAAAQNTWHDIETDGLPDEAGWYEVTVEEMTDLGSHRYTDIISLGHVADVGLVWHLTSPGCRVLAWRERPQPYRRDNETR